jgi:hypothetical protein
MGGSEKRAYRNWVTRGKVSPFLSPKLTNFVKLRR